MERTGRTSRTAGFGCALVVLLGGWSCSSPPPADVSSASASAPVRPGCVGPDEGRYEAPPGAPQDAGGNGQEGALLTLGDGSTAVLLVPQSDGDICQWLPTGRELVAAGYRVVLMNWSQPYDESVRTAYAVVRAAGAQRVVLMGASQGASYALLLAAELRPDAVVCLSADPGPSGVDVEEPLRQYAGPLLLVGSDDDVYAPAGVTRHLAKVHPGSEQVVLVRGADHGVALLAGSDHDRVWAAIRRELRVA